MIKFAYADDHVVVRDAICELFRTRGTANCTLKAESGEELITKLETTTEIPDICILDVFMGGMDGYQTFKMIRKKWPTMKTLVFTAYNTEYFLTKLIMAGVNGYLLKKATFQELEQAMKAIYDTGIYHSNEIASSFYRSAFTQHKGIPEITDREAVFLKHCCTDMSYEMIAQKMNTTYKTIDGIRLALFKKLNVGSRPGLVVFAIQCGLVKLMPDN